MPKFAVQQTRKGFDGKKETSTTLVEADNVDACINNLLSRTCQRPDVDLVGYSIYETVLIRKVKIEISQQHKILKGDDILTKS